MAELVKDLVLVSLGMGIGVVLMCIAQVSKMADEVQEDTTVEKLNDLYSTYENLPSDLKEDYGELMCYFTDLDELHRYRNDIIHYSWCKNMTDVARHILNNDPDFTSLSESVTGYFDFEAYGQYLDDNGRFVETDHGIYELP